MFYKHKIPIFILTILVIAGFISSGSWFFHKHIKHEIAFKDNSNPVSQKNDAKSKLPKLVFSQVTNVPNGVFNYGGSTSWAELSKRANPAIQEALPQFALHYVQPIGKPPSSGAGIKMLLSGKLAFAESSRPISSQENNQALQLGFKLEQIPVAIDILAFAVNPNLNVPGLTIDQIRSIYTGKLTNWKQVGGPNLPIKPYSQPIGSGTRESFARDVLSNQRFGSNVRNVPTTTVAVQKLAQNPGGIYYATASEILQQCNIKPLPIGRNLDKFVTPYQEPFVPPSQCPRQHNQLNIAAVKSAQYPMTRLLYVIVKQNGTQEQLAGKAYADIMLTKQGQELVSQAGLIKMR
ncbi:MAG: PstS family phosphate ABC transporter substrate-binding protein [Stigonema ocellatum SAG 48.90 = DSM 106950]|nr:PstS family phosphate ABC transporter substrate-binding protein [Stigonema ocellatum SAG 48.90 = DSM 106950]